MQKLDDGLGEKMLRNTTMSDFYKINWKLTSSIFLDFHGSSYLDIL